jgi:hypothetical protein
MVQDRQFGRRKMKVFTTTRRLVSMEQVTAAMDELANAYGIQGHCYDESAGRGMSEFDALKWVTLCSQRVALRQREYEAMSSTWGIPEIPQQFLGIYETNYHSEPVPLENTDESLSELAA